MRAPKIITLVAALTVAVAGCGSHASGSTPGSSPPSVAPVTTASSTAAPATSAPAATDPDAGLKLIDHVRWGKTDKGRQLQVFPTAAGRTDEFGTAGARAWAEVLAAAPNANTPGMYDQFMCHWNFARAAEPDKPSWNLEPWRPAVGYAATVAALCNPGGPED